MTDSRGTAVVLGGSAAGASTALLLARRGWSVTVLDPELPRLLEPGRVPTVRPGAPHLVHAHGFASRAHFELRSRLPDVLDDLVAAGAGRVPLAEMSPPASFDGGRPGDDDITVLQARRHLFDHVLIAALARESVTLVAERATGLVLDHDSAPPVVRGVQLAGGRRLEADVTVDAGGRRSPVTGWLAAAGYVQPERLDESIARYYSRHFRVVGDPPPLNAGIADVHGFTCHVQLLFRGDGDTAVLALAVHNDDPVLKRLRHPEAFDAILAANPAFAPWHRVLEPTSEIFSLGAFDNRMRSLVRDGEPLVLGLHQVGDALAMTNPTRGRGVAFALMGAGHLVDVLDTEPDPAAAAQAFEAWRARVLLLHYRECALTDTVAAAQLRAGLAGDPVPSNAPDLELPEGHPVTVEEVTRAARLDPDLFRILMRASVMLDDDRVIESAAVTARVRELLATAPSPTPDAADPPDLRGTLHDREHLRRLLEPFG